MPLIGALNPSNMRFYIDAVKECTTFTGRAGRQEFWNFFLFFVIVSISIFVIETLLGNLGILTVLWNLVNVLPALAITVRRLHDTNRNGWWLLIGFVPVIGAIVLLVFALQASGLAENRYGLSVKKSI